MYNTFDDSGLTALTNHMKSTRKTADESASAVTELGDDLQEFAQQLTEVIKELDDLKLDKDNAAAVYATAEVVE